MKAASLVCLAAAAFCGPALAANPLVEWKDRLFGSDAATTVQDAPKDGPIVLALDRPERVRIDARADAKKFPKGESRFREIELAREVPHASVRVQVVAEPNAKGRGHTVFKPLIYLYDQSGDVADAKPVEPLHLDIRPFKRTRLLACVEVEKLHRFAIATTPEVVGKSYESQARDRLSAPTQGGFYYSTDAQKVKLPYAETGELILEVTETPGGGKGC